jgi:hypothetical protein
MASLITAMGCVLASWVLLTFIFCGIGLIVVRLAGMRQIVPGQFLLLPWLGLAGTILILQIWHLVFPVAGAALTLIVMLGVVGWRSNGLSDLAVLRRRLSAHPIISAIAAIALIWLADRAIGPCNFGDSGLYHLSAVRWDNQFSIVPGLVNLHGRLAFNNASFLIHAMLEVGPGFGRSGHIVNGLLIAMTLPMVFVGGWNFLHARGGRWGLSVFPLLFLIVLVRYAISAEISSMSTDLPAALIALIAFWRLAALVSGQSAEMGGRDFDLLVIVWLLASAIAIKLSIIFVAALAMPIALGYWLLNQRAKSISWRPLVVAVVGAAIILIVWMARGYILSGCPMYPSAFGKMNLPWTATAEQLSFEQVGIAQYAKTTYLNREMGISGWSWVKPWIMQVFIVRSFAEGLIPALLAAVGIAFYFFLGRNSISRRRRKFARRLIVIMSIPILPALLIWFLVAPSPRMGLHLWWSLAGTTLAGAMMLISSHQRERLRLPLFFVILAIACLPALHLAALIKFRYSKEPSTGYFQKSPLVAFVNSPGPDHGFHPTPMSILALQYTRSGLGVYVPTDPIAVCWDAPLPCTQYFNPDLKLRIAGDLGGGFVLDLPAAEKMTK